MALGVVTLLTNPVGWGILGGILLTAGIAAGYKAIKNHRYNKKVAELKTIDSALENDLVISTQVNSVNNPSELTSRSINRRLSRSGGSNSAPAVSVMPQPEAEESDYPNSDSKMNYSFFKYRQATQMQEAEFDLRNNNLP